MGTIAAWELAHIYSEVRGTEGEEAICSPWWITLCLFSLDLDSQLNKSYTHHCDLYLLFCDVLVSWNKGSLSSLLWARQLSELRTEQPLMTVCSFNLSIFTCCLNISNIFQQKNAKYLFLLCKGLEMSQWFISTCCEFIISINVEGFLLFLFLLLHIFCACIIHLWVYTEGEKSGGPNHPEIPWNQERHVIQFRR